MLDPQSIPTLGLRWTPCPEDGFKLKVFDGPQDGFKLKVSGPVKDPKTDSSSRSLMDPSLLKLKVFDGPKVDSSYRS